MKKRYFLPLLLLPAILFIPLYQIYSTQEGELFRSTPLESHYVYDLPYPFKELFIDVEGGQINAIHFPVENPRGTVVYYHGRGGNIATKWADSATDFTELGYDVIMMDYRGFGKSYGLLNETLLLSDAEAVYTFAKEINPDLPLVIYGCSLGSGIASYVASKCQPALLILESPYYNMIDLGKHVKPFLPELFVKLILKYHLRTDLWIPHVSCKIAFLHSREDELIPYDSSLRLLKLTHGNTDLISFTEVGHFNLTKSRDYKKELEKILIHNFE